MQEKLGITHLVGTPMLRAYMHGFFIDNKLYNKAKAIADPFAYESYKQKRIEQKIEDERKSRISSVKKLPKVNASMAARIIVENDSKSKKQTEKNAQGNLLEDSRFAAMFEDPAFAIDEKSEEYRQLHPNADPAKDKKLLAEHFEELNDEESESSEVDSDVDSEESDYEDIPEAQTVKTAPKMYVAKDAVAAKAFTEGRSLKEERDMPLGIRTKKNAVGGVKRRSGGNKEVTFVPTRAPDGKRKKNSSRGRGRRR